MSDAAKFLAEVARAERLLGLEGVDAVNSVC